jgi:preprotein translocase subunit SecB
MSNQYLSEFQIIGSSVKSLKIRNDFVSLSDVDNIKRTIDVSHSVPVIELIDEGETFSGIVLLKIKSTISANKKKYTVDMTIEGCFNAPAQIGEDTFKGMLKVNGVTSLYGIARGFVQSTTSQTLLSGSVLLPMFNVAAYSEDLDEQES